MIQARRHGGGKQGWASVTCSPDSCGLHSGSEWNTRLAQFFAGIEARSIQGCRQILPAFAAGEARATAIDV